MLRQAGALGAALGAWGLQRACAAAAAAAGPGAALRALATSAALHSPHRTDSLRSPRYQLTTHSMMDEPVHPMAQKVGGVEGRKGGC